MFVVIKQLTCANDVLKQYFQIVITIWKYLQFHTTQSLTFYKFINNLLNDGYTRLLMMHQLILQCKKNGYLLSNIDLTY